MTKPDQSPDSLNKDATRYNHTFCRNADKKRHLICRFYIESGTKIYYIINNKIEASADKAKTEDPR